MRINTKKKALSTEELLSPAKRTKTRRFRENQSLRAAGFGFVSNTTWTVPKAKRAIYRSDAMRMLRASAR